MIAVTLDKAEARYVERMRRASYSRRRSRTVTATLLSEELGHGRVDVNATLSAVASSSVGPRLCVVSPGQEWVVISPHNGSSKGVMFRHHASV